MRAALADFSKRQRRFGKTSEQVEGPGPSVMLKQRIITALVLCPSRWVVFLLEGAFFALFIGAVVSLGAWEWARPGRL